MIGDIHYRALVAWGWMHKLENAVYYKQYEVVKENDISIWYADPDHPGELIRRSMFARRRFARFTKEEALKDLLARLWMHQALLEGRVRAVQMVVRYLAEQVKGEDDE